MRLRRRMAECLPSWIVPEVPCAVSHPRLLLRKVTGRPVPFPLLPSLNLVENTEGTQTMTTATATEKRPYISFPQATVQIEQGLLTVVGNGGETLYIHTENKPGQRDFLAVRGVDYHVTAHLERDVNGTWKIQGTPSEQRTYLYISRIQFGKDVTEAARRAIQAIVLGVADQFDSTALRAGGRLATINNDIQRLDGKIAEMAAELATMEERRAALRAEEAILKMEEAGQ